MNTRGAVLRREAAKVAPILLGTAILSFGLYNIHGQSSITEGGVLGMTLLLRQWFGISPSISSFVMDMTCYVIGFRFLGRQFAKYSLVASCGFALFYRLYEQFPPLLPSLDGAPLLAALLGGLFVGLGVGLVVRAGAAAGGDDALALVLQHLSRQPISRCYLFTDLVVLGLSLTYIPAGRIFYSLITVTVSSFVIGVVHKAGAPSKADQQAV